MCYPYPGPRCSAHAHADWLHALKKYEDETNPDTKLALKEELLEKQALYDATPRGQNSLRRAQAETTDPEERAAFFTRATAGQQLRAKQMQAYRLYTKTSPDEDSAERALLAENNLTGRYATAAAAAYENILSLYETTDAEIHLSARDTITVTTEDEEYKLLILPMKYQQPWMRVSQQSAGVYNSGDTALDDILNQSRRYVNLSADQKKEISDWAVNHLKEQGYKLIAIVHPSKVNLTYITVDELPRFASTELKLRKNFSGTTRYKGTAEEVKQALQGTPFSDGEVITAPSGAIIVTGVPPQAKKDCRIGNMWLSYTATENEAWYQVKTIPPVTRYQLHALIKVHTDAPIGTSTAALRELTRKPEKHPPEDIEQPQEMH